MMDMVCRCGDIPLIGHHAKSSNCTGVSGNRVGVRDTGRGRAIRKRDEIYWLLGESVINDVIRDVLGDGVEYNPVGALPPGSVAVPFHYTHSSGGTVYMSFLPDGKMHVAIQTGYNLFDVGKGYDAEGLRQKFSEELRRLTDIIDTLNVK